LPGKHSLPLLLLAIVAGALIVSAIGPTDRLTWWLEVAPVLIAVPVLILTVRRFPLIDAPVLEEGRGYDVRLRAVLDEEQFPGPLRLLAFWRRDWSIASDWYRWPLVSE